MSENTAFGSMGIALTRQPERKKNTAKINSKNTLPQTSADFTDCH